jgi:UDP-2,3-diacylglucosamine hydrolase
MAQGMTDTDAPATDTAVPRFAELAAPAHWGTVDFISDLHLHPGEPETFEAWRTYLRHTPANAVFILGDLFEVWVGDDALSEPGSFEAQCADALHAAAARAPVYFMHGNRDFLVGEAFLQHCGVQGLDDPTVLVFGGQRILMSHGDALCLDDTDYQRFRALARSAAWQQQFLAQPLAERRAQARGIRAQSEARKQSAGVYADLDPAATLAWLAEAHATVLVHGHTHRPAQHVLAPGLTREVLSDWDLAARPPRAEVLRLTARGLERVAMAPM